MSFLSFGNTYLINKTFSPFASLKSLRKIIACEEHDVYWWIANTLEYKEIKSLFRNDLIVKRVDYFFDFLDDFIRDSVLFVGHLHMPPHSIVVFLCERHVLMRVVHVSSFVFGGTSEDHWEEFGHGGVQGCDITDVLQVGDVQLFVVEDCLIEICNNPLDFLIPAESFIQVLFCFWHLIYYSEKDFNGTI